MTQISQSLRVRKSMRCIEFKNLSFSLTKSENMNHEQDNQ